MELIVPSTFGADERDMKMRAVKYGFLARAASIFGAEKITIFEDEDDSINTDRSSELLKKYLEYAETPPYLRKKLIPFDEDLKYANILPALQTTSHGYSDNFREAYVKNVENGEATVEAGLEEDIKVYGDLEEGQRITVKMIGEREGKVIDSDELDTYWTYEVSNTGKKLGSVLEKRDATVLGTSAHGDDYRETEFETSGEISIVFGSAWRGIPSLVDRGDVDRDQFDHLLNLVPEQNTRTVRTEEALMICLARVFR